MELTGEIQRREDEWSHLLARHIKPQTFPFTPFIMSVVVYKTAVHERFDPHDRFAGFVRPMNGERLPGTYVGQSSRVQHPSLDLYSHVRSTLI